ncbi:MAG: response regulator [Polyangiaceae bacterium]
MQPACFLVVDDEVIVTRAISHILGRFGSIATASSVAEANEQLRSGRVWSGFIIDLWLPDGSGLEVLARVRERQPLAPAILLSGALEPGAVNGAYEMDARCLCKPCPPEHLRRFAQDALIADSEIPGRLGQAVRDLAAKHRLTPAQTEILLSTVQGIDRASIVASRCVSENTHKTQVRGILRKTRTLSLGELRDRVLRTVAGAA